MLSTQMKRTHMKLSQYAKQIGISNKTAHRMFQRGELDAYQLPSGTIIVNDPASNGSASIAIYARVSSSDQKGDLQRQVQRLRDYCAANGYRIEKEVPEIASGLNDNRPKFIKRISDRSVGKIVVEHKDRATRFGFNYIKAILESNGRQIEVINETDTKDELIDDFVSIITSMAARIYGRRSSKRKAQEIKACVQGRYN
jgi:predicted site-specific integrase-resolvase